MHEHARDNHEQLRTVKMVIFVPRTSKFASCKFRISRTSTSSRHRFRTENFDHQPQRCMVRHMAWWLSTTLGLHVWCALLSPPTRQLHCRLGRLPLQGEHHQKKWSPIHTASPRQHNRDTSTATTHHFTTLHLQQTVRYPTRQSISKNAETMNLQQKV